MLKPEDEGTIIFETLAKYLPVGAA